MSMVLTVERPHISQRESNILWRDGRIKQLERELEELREEKRREEERPA